MQQNCDIYEFSMYAMYIIVFVSTCVLEIQLQILNTYFSIFRLYEQLDVKSLLLYSAILFRMIVGKYDNETFGM